MASETPSGDHLRRIVAFIVEEFLEALPAIVFFAIGFNIIVATTQLILADYAVQFANFLVATTTALLVGKAVLVANALPFLRRLDTAPLIQPILYKTTVYCAVVFLARVVERCAEYLIHGGTFADMPTYVATHFSWHRFVAVQIWIFVLFLIYTTATELNALFGDGELFRTFFTRGSSRLRPLRTRRIRTLVRISRLAEEQGLATLKDPASPAHIEMVGLISELATDDPLAGHPVPVRR